MFVLYFSKIVSEFANTAYPLFFLHSLFQLFIIMMATFMFILGVLSYQCINQYINQCILFITMSLFSIVGILEFLHMMTYLGMFSFVNYFFLPSPYWFEILSNLTIGIGIFSILLIPNFINIACNNVNKYKLFFHVFLIITTTVLLFSFSKFLPSLMIESVHKTLSNVLILITIFFYLCNIIIGIRYFFATKNYHYIYINNGLIKLVISGIFLLLAKEPSGAELLIAHSLKVIGFFFLFLGLYYTTFNPIYHKKWLDYQARTRFIIRRKIDKACRKERKRIAQDIHDSLGQTLFVLVIQLKILKKLSPNELADEQITYVEKLAHSLMKEAKELAFTLRPSIVEEVGIKRALEMLIEKFNACDKAYVNFQHAVPNDFLHPDIETVIYRVCQEAITNAFKYANAKQIIVSLTASKHFIHAKISDNGSGICDDSVAFKENTLGLNGMKERVLSVNGTLTIVSEKEKGTIVEVNIPVHNQVRSLAAGDELR